MSAPSSSIAREVDAAVEIVRDERDKVALVIERLHHRAQTQGDPQSARYARGLTLLLAMFADQTYEESESWALYQEFSQTNDLLGQLIALTSLIGLHRLRGDGEAAYALVVERLRPLLAMGEATSTRVLATNMCGVVALEHDRIDEGIIEFHRALDDARTLGLTARIAHIQANIGELFYISGNIEEGEAILLQAYATMARVSSPWLRTFVSVLLALCKLALDRPQDARKILEPLLDESFENLGALGSQRAFYCATVAYTLLECDELERAEYFCTEAHLAIEGIAERQLRPYAWWARGHLQHRRGNLCEAVADLNTAVAESSGSGYGFMPMRATREIAEIEASRGDWSAAYAAQQRYIVLFERVQNQASRTRLQVVRMQAALQDALERNRREKDLGELKNRFMAMASHEFRTPLTAIQSATEVLRHYHEQLPVEERTQIIADIDRAVLRLRSTMEQVLTLTRVDAGYLTLKPVALPLATWCQRVARDVLAAHPGRDIASIVFDPPALAEAQPLLDADLMQQAVGNLLVNAYKYSPAGTGVVLTIRRVGEHLQLSIRDQGIGIPLPDQALLFQSFHRASNTGSVQGTGLGLAIVRRAAEAHGGTVKVESAEGQGSLFTLELPWREP